MRRSPFTLTAATVIPRATAAGQVTPGGTSGSRTVAAAPRPDDPCAIAVVGTGTGRFVGATGGYTFSIVFDPATVPSSVTIDGAVVRPGS